MTFYSTQFFLHLHFQYRTIEAERLNFIEQRKKSARKYSRIVTLLDKEKSDLQYTLDAEQKGIHARRDSEVRLEFHDSQSIWVRVECWTMKGKAFHVIYDPRREKILKMDFFLPLWNLFFLSRQLPSFHFNISSFSFLSLQAQIKILNLMDRMEKTTQALMKKKSTLMELEVRAKKVHLVFLSIAFLSLQSLPQMFIMWMWCLFPRAKFLLVWVDTIKEKVSKTLWKWQLKILFRKSLHHIVSQPTISF